MSDPVSWLDTPAARFRAAGGDVMPTEAEFRRAADADERAEARRAYDVAHGRDPAPGVTVEDRQQVYAGDLAGMKMRANWVGTGTREGDSDISERLRRMGAYAHAQATADGAEVTGPGAGLNSAQREAYRRMQDGQAGQCGPLRGVPHA